VNSLYAVYENASEGFAERYLAMLAAGGTKHYSELLKPFGLDAKDPEFWDGGLSVIAGMIDELGNDGLTRSRMIDTPTRRAVLGAGAFAAGSLFTIDASIAQAPLPATPACHDGDEATLRQTEGPFFKPSSPERDCIA